jgi:hypothetical protein
VSKKRPTVREIYLRPAATAEDAEAIEANFFQRVRLPNGVTKTTSDHRLDGVNEAILECLPTERPLLLMDVATSSGISTLEWSESLTEAGIDHSMLGGDVSLQAYLVPICPGIDVLLDPTGEPLHFDLFGRGISGAVPLPIPSAAIRLLRVTTRLLTRVSYRRRMEIRLVSPRLCRKPSVSLIEDDILTNTSDALLGRFHVVRAANILNRSYFDERAIGRMIGNLKARLRPQGLLVICRTHPDGTNQATAMRLESDGSLRIVKRLGGGFEVEATALQ